MRLALGLCLTALVLTPPAFAQGKAEKRAQAAKLVQRLKTLHDDPKSLLGPLMKRARKKDKDRDHDDDERLTKAQLEKQVLRKEKKRVRKALHKLGPAAEHALVGAWKSLPEEDSVYALVLLTRIAKPSGLKALIQASKSKRLYHRRLAAGYLPELTKLNRKAIVKAELRLLKDNDGQVLQGVLGALRALAPEDAWGPLIAFVEDSLTNPELAEDGRIGAALRALGAILKKYPDLFYVESLLSSSASVASQTDDQRRGARVIDVFEVSEAGVAAPYLRSILSEVYLPDEEPDVSVDSLDPLRPFSAELRSSAIRALGVMKDREAVTLLAKALRDTHQQPRRDAMSAISLIQPRGKDRKLVFQTALRLLVDSDRILRRLTHTWLKRTSGANLPLNYTRWRKWLETDYVRVQALEILSLHAKGQGHGSVKAFFVSEGAEGLDDWLSGNDFKSSADFLKYSDLVPETWPPEDYGAIPEAELLRRYEESE